MKRPLPALMTCGTVKKSSISPVVYADCRVRQGRRGGGAEGHGDARGGPGGATVAVDAVVGPVADQDAAYWQIAVVVAVGGRTSREGAGGGHHAEWIHPTRRSHSKVRFTLACSSYSVVNSRFLLEGLSYLEVNYKVGDLGSASVCV